MTGEVKRRHYKRCLSRKKQSMKLSKNELCPNETARKTYTALRSRKSASLSPTESSDRLARLSVVYTSDVGCAGGDIFKGEPRAGLSGDHRIDEFNFCVNEYENNDVKSKVVDDLHSIRCKKIDSEELESACLEGVLKFKRTRNAINLKQPSLCLEICKTPGSDTVNPKDAKPTDETDYRDNIKTLPTEDGSLHQSHEVNVIVGNMLSKNDNNKQNHDKEDRDEMNTVSREEIAKYREHSDRMENSSNDRVCPVCSFSFLLAENVDTINKHINSCLDSCSDNRVKEQGLQEVNCKGIGEDSYFCQLCQKDLSRMNSQRRQQHINRCCDQASEKEMPTSNSVSVQAQCPICGKGFKMTKARQAHLKKCAQQHNLEAQHLLQIVNRQKQQEDKTSLTTASDENVLCIRNLIGVKRKRRGATLEHDLDEQTQLALALSASMAPPLPPQLHFKKGVKGKGKKIKGGTKLPALLLRDDESAQRAVMMRAAHVLCTREEIEEDDEISCTPALAPSRLAQKVSDNQTLPGKETLQEYPTTFASTSEAMSAIGLDCNTVEGNHMCANSGNDIVMVEECFSPVDPSLSRSFLNVLYGDEDNDSKPFESKAPRLSPLWSLASIKNQSHQEFYVPGLLPSASPKEPVQFSSSPVQKNVYCNTFHDQAAANVATNEETLSPLASESNMQVSANPSGVDECERITPSQAVNVQMLMDLCDGDHISNVSANSQQQNHHKGTHLVLSGVSKLLQDLSFMVNNSWLSDVVVNLKDGKKLMAHSFILSLRSNVLAQMLEEQRSGCKDGRVLYIQFEEVKQSVFEVVLKHMYTGDVTVPEHCEWGDITVLAERLELRCLLKACKDAMFRLKQVQENEGASKSSDCIVVDAETFERDIWTSDQDNYFGLEFQTPQDDEEEVTTDQLNDDDIEEIIIFQTQSLHKEGSENFKDSPKIPLNLNEQQTSKFESDLTGYFRNKFGEETAVEDWNPYAFEGTEKKLRVLFSDGNPSHIRIEGSKASSNAPEEDDCSHSHVKQIGNKPPGDAEKREKFQFNKTLVRERIVQENTSRNKEHPIPPNEKEEQELRYHHCASAESSENDSFLRDSSNERTTDGETLNVEVEHSFDINEESHLTEEALEIYSNVETYPKNTDIYNVSTDLLNDANEVDHDDAKEPDVSGQIQPNSSQDLNILAESYNNPGCAIVFVTGEGDRREKEDLEGSLREIPLSDHAESEGSTEKMDENVDESITLLSDYEEEVLDGSTRKTDMTFVPETPHGKEGGERGSTSSKFLSKLSVSEEGDVTVTGSSQSKSPRQLNKEANQFLSKLRQRAERSKGKKQVKLKSRNNGVSENSWVEISAKRLTISEESCGKQDNLPLGETTQLSGNIETRNVSPIRMTPRGRTGIVSPMRTPSRGSKSPRGSKIRSCSPRNRNEECVLEVIEVGNSSPVSPLKDDYVVQTCETSKKSREKLARPSDIKGISRENEFYSGGPVKGENVEPNGNVLDVGINRDFPLSTTSSSDDTMSLPIPSPSNYFFDAVYTSPPSQQIALSPDLDSPSLPVDWKSPPATGGMGSHSQSQSPESPSVCSFSLHYASRRHSENESNHSVKKLEFEQNSDNPRKEGVVKIDLNVPLKERLKAARVGGIKTFCISDDDEGDSDIDRGNSCTRNEDSSGCEQDMNSPAETKQQVESISFGDEFDFYDDGGFNVDIDELNKLEVLNVDSDVTATVKRHCNKDIEKDSVFPPQVNAAVTNKDKRKAPSSQRKVQDSDDSSEDGGAPSKRLKKSHTKSIKQGEQKAKQPVTPMPNYIEMATPALKSELHKFGVRALPKKKMILKLKEIYDYTHSNDPQTQGSKTEHAPNRVESLSSSIVVSHSVDKVEGNGIASSDNSDQEDTEFGECTILIEDDVITASQQFCGGDLNERLACYIRDNKELFKKVLQFQPLDLVSLHQQIKCEGISCSLGKLVDFLDQQCITFTTAGSRQPRRRGRKKKRK